MIIEVGRKYKMRNGDITEIIRSNGGVYQSDQKWHYDNEDDNGHLVTGSMGIPHGCDLMEEINE